MRAKLRLSGRAISLSLLLILLLVFWVYRLQSSPIQLDWQQPVKLLVYPINADASHEAGQYIKALGSEHFDDIERFFAREATLYRIRLERPVEVYLQPIVEKEPPQVPQEPSILESIWWGLNMRLWVEFNETFDVDANSIRVFMNFYALDSQQAAKHSLGLQKGRIGLVNGYADLRLQGVNNFIAVHEALHTLGAQDRYDANTLEPLWPDGYADPVQVPLFPQTRAEVMGGRMQIVPGWSVLPPGLEHARIGPITATEIGWRDPDLMADQ